LCILLHYSTKHLIGSPQYHVIIISQSHPSAAFAGWLHFSFRHKIVPPRFEVLRMKTANHIVKETLYNPEKKAKQRCVVGIGMCLYAQLVQTKNKQCKSAIILLCYHPHLSDFCSRARLTQPYNQTAICLMYTTAYLILTKTNINCKPLPNLNLCHCKHR